MLINKPEEDDGITGQFNHLCRTHPAAATSSNASPRAPRQIFEAWHFTLLYPATTKGVYFNSHSIGPSQRPTNSRDTGRDQPSAGQRLVPAPGAGAVQRRGGRRQWHYLRFRARRCSAPSARTDVSYPSFAVFDVV